MSNITDPIADMLTRMRNAIAVRHQSVSMPTSKTKVSLAQILKREGYIRDYDVLGSKPQGTLRIHLQYREGRQSAIGGLRRISRPGLRMYVAKSEIPRVYGGLGTAIISTPRGLMTGQEAWRLGVGGELFCYVW